MHLIVNFITTNIKIKYNIIIYCYVILNKREIRCRITKTVWRWQDGEICKSGQWCIEPAGGVKNIISYIMQNIIEELKQYYLNEINEQVVSLPEALSCIYMLTGKKFIVIIDEWDVLIRDNSADDKIQEEYINFLRAMFKGSELYDERKV